MPWVGFALMIPVFDRAKTVHALDRAATLIGIQEDQEGEIRSTYPKKFRWGVLQGRYYSGRTGVERKIMLH
jgi:hypothetical protein